MDNESGEPYRYTGEWYGGYIDLLHLRARWYSPGEGIFLSRDAVAGNILRPQSRNGWNYVEANPINFVDPSGYCRPEPGQTSCQESFETNGGTIRGTTSILGETSLDSFQAGGVTIREIKVTAITCPSATKTGSCQLTPSQRPTLQPWLDRGNQVGYLINWPAAIVGETKTLVRGGLAYDVVLEPSGSLSPQRIPRISLRPNGALQEVPTGWARVSTGVAYGLPVIIGIANAREIQYRAEAGEISQGQANMEQGANFGYTIVASVGGGYIIPHAAALTSNPVGWATAGGVCLAYDISVIQGITNNMIEGQPLWPAYINSRAEANRVFMFGHGADFDYWTERMLLSGATPIITYINSDGSHQ